MKTTRVSAGEYTFVNAHGVTGEILKQPEGGWTIYLPETSNTVDFFMRKSEAVHHASALRPDGRYEWQ